MSRRTKPKQKTADPTVIPLAKPAPRKPPGKPLINLTEEDLRAAGVQFHTMGAGDTVVGRAAGEWADEIASGASGTKRGGKAGKGAGKGKGKGVRTWDDSEEEEEGEGESDGGEGDDEAEEEETDRAIEAFWDEFFDALMWTVPFSFLYLMLDVLTNLSYARHPPFSAYLKNYIMSTPTIGIIMFYTTRHQASIWVRGLLTAVSIACGMRLVWLVNKAPYLTVIAQGPAMGTMWILTIVQLPLSLAVAALATVFAWLYQRGLKVIP